MATLVYVVASRPYPEKVFNSRFFSHKETARAELENLGSLAKHFDVYPAIIQVMEDESEAKEVIEKING